MFGLGVMYETDPVGTINERKQQNYNIPFRKPDAKLMVTEPITGNYNRQEGDIPPQIPYHSKIHHRSVTMDLNNTINFDPTSAGHQYYKEHETNLHLHHGGAHSHPANKTKPNHKDLTVPNKIENWRKRTNVFEKPIEHSLRLQTVNI